MTAAPLVRTGWDALPQAFAKLDPRHTFRSPVIFVVWVGSVLTTVLAVQDPSVFTISVTLWLWATVLFANLAEAVAEGRGKAQAETPAQDPHRDHGPAAARRRHRGAGARHRRCASATSWSSRPARSSPATATSSRGWRPSTSRRSPASPHPSSASPAATGAPSPAARPCCRTGSSCKVTSKPGETFIDRMIALVEGAPRQKTPNEIALTILLTTLTLIFIFAVGAIQPMAIYSGSRLSLVVLVALLVCLIPTTIGALLSAIGIAGMDRLVQHNVLAMSGRAVEAAGDVSTLLLDKTGTITFGNRQASDVVPVDGATRAELLRAAYLSSLADETPEGRSIVEHALGRGRRPGHRLVRRAAPGRRRVRARSRPPPGCPGSTCPTAPGAQGRRLRRRGVGRVDGAARRPATCTDAVDGISATGGTPLVVGGRRAGRRGPHPRCRAPQGRRQARHARALRPAARDGHPHRDDHRRQPPHRQGHRRRGRRRRLPRRGHPRGQDGPDQGRAGGRQARRDDRRRHQRRPGTGPGRRRASR